MRWRRRRHETPPEQRTYEELLAAAHQAIARMGDYGQQSLNEGDVLESIEVVRVRAGWENEAEPGILMMWCQSELRYGLLMSMRRMLEVEYDTEGVASHLHLALYEPHGDPADGTRTWYTELP